MIPFSVCLIAKNEERTLPRLLDSLKEFRQRGGEIILVDTGSTDQTIKLAKAAGCKVFEQKFEVRPLNPTVSEINRRLSNGDSPVISDDAVFFDFSAARNFAATKAKNNVILTPDCDEIYMELPLDALEKVVKDGAERINSTIVTTFDPTGKPVTSFIHCRAYDRRKYAFQGITHEVLTGSGKEAFVPIVLHHRPDDAKSRGNYLPALAYEAYNQPANPRASFYYARELMNTRRYSSAINEFDRTIALNGWQIERAQAASYKGDCWLWLKREEEAVKAWQEAFNIDNNKREPLLKLASYYLDKSDFKRAAAYAAAALQLPFTNAYIDDLSHYRECPHVVLFRALWWMGEKEKARKHYDEAVKLNPELPIVKSNRRFFYPSYWPKVSVVIPHLGRDEKLKRLISSLELNGGYENMEIIVENDSFENRQGAPKTFKKGVERSTGELIMYLGNDCICKENMVKEAVLSMFDNFGEPMDGMVCLNDGVYNGTKATHWLASKKLLPYIGGEFFATCYEHCFCDDELTTRCQRLYKYAYAKEAVIYHDNVLNHGGQMDEVLKIAYNKERFARDQLTYAMRKPTFPFYPPVTSIIDLRRKIKDDPTTLKVLNIGIGEGNSGLAVQLPHIPFKQLDLLDVHEPYITKGKTRTYDAKAVNFILEDMRKVENWGDYDLILIFDVLEHLIKEESLAILDKIKQAGTKLIVFLPLEKEFRPNVYGAESQDHLSLWTEDDFKQLGFETEVLKDFHKEAGRVFDALWAVR